MHWKSWASRSALPSPSSSPGWKKNKIDSGLEIENLKSSKELGLDASVLSGFIMVSLVQGLPVPDGVSMHGIRVILSRARAVTVMPEAGTSIRRSGTATWVP